MTFIQHVPSFNVYLLLLKERLLCILVVVATSLQVLVSQPPDSQERVPSLPEAGSATLRPLKGCLLPLSPRPEDLSVVRSPTAAGGIPLCSVGGLLGSLGVCFCQGDSQTGSFESTVLMTPEL